MATAAFKKPSLPMQIADAFGPTLFRDEMFADLFSERGRGVVSPAVLALVTLLQYTENLTDRQAADAVRARMDWKYLLALDLDDPGFDFSILSKFRDRLVEGSAETRLFDKVVEACRTHGWIKAGGRQRSDSTHVVAAVRTLNRLELTTETMRAALNALAVVDAAWVRAHIPAPWLDHYGPRTENFRFSTRAGERDALMVRVGEDGYALLAMVYAATSPPWLRSLGPVEILRRLWIEQYELVEGATQVRGGDNQPPSGRRINSPYDADARYATKRGASWMGSKVHLTETCDEEGPNLLTHVETVEAPAQDADALEAMHGALEAKELLPAEHLVDAGYTPAEQLERSATRYGVRLVGPPREDTSWQARQGGAYALDQFTVDWERTRVVCPQGHESTSWTPGTSSRGTPVTRVAFSRETCGACPVRAQCTTSKEHRRKLTLRPREEHEALKNARAEAATEEQRATYNVRAGVEGTISQGVRRFGLRRSRYRGTPKTRLQHQITGAAINVVRIAAWTSGGAGTGRSPSAFVRAMTPAQAA